MNSETPDANSEKPHRKGPCTMDTHTSWCYADGSMLSTVVPIAHRARSIYSLRTLDVLTAHLEVGAGGYPPTAKPTLGQSRAKVTYCIRGSLFQGCRMRSSSHLQALRVSTYIRRSVQLALEQTQSDGDHMAVQSTRMVSQRVTPNHSNPVDSLCVGD